MKTGSMNNCCCNRWRHLSGHAAPLVKAARAGIAEVAGAEEPPRAFRHGVQELGQVGAAGARQAHRHFIGLPGATAENPPSPRPQSLRLASHTGS